MHFLLCRNILVFFVSQLAVSFAVLNTALISRNFKMKIVKISTEKAKAVKVLQFNWNMSLKIERGLTVSSFSILLIDPCKSERDSVWI